MKYKSFYTSWSSKKREERKRIKSFGIIRIPVWLRLLGEVIVIPFAYPEKDGKKFLVGLKEEFKGATGIVLVGDKIISRYDRVVLVVIINE